ncbi:MAG: outer membrane lipoprotein carrier protein LolA [Desulfobacterales bacterium]|nr:outer membrane lipoprotein carrier protein LolA [Desulfobacterales bacterium]
MRSKLVSVRVLWSVLAAILVVALPVAAQEKLDPLVAEILDLVEARYTRAGFSARFHLTSTLKAMQVTDEASGQLFVKYPGKMRWVYETPSPMLFITDGESLWMYQPDENQVTVGLASEVLGGQEGASFLSDIRLLRKAFSISLDPGAGEDIVRLKLVPLSEAQDIAEVYLRIRRDTHDIVEVITNNLYGDQTRIALTGFDYGAVLPDRLFSFDIPPGTDVLQF